MYLVGEFYLRQRHEFRNDKLDIYVNDENLFEHLYTHTNQFMRLTFFCVCVCVMASRYEYSRMHSKLMVSILLIDYY